MRLSLLTFLLIVSPSDGIPVDNGVEGEPEIECGPSSFTVNFNTRTPFAGHVYVKGLYEDQKCRNDEGGRQVAGIELPFDTCQIARTRSLNPKGVFVSYTVVISFHPQFVTKVDRAYRIECFYMESEKSVSSEVEVSDLTTLAQTALVPMPICHYDILAGGPTGQEVQYATIGQQVYHKWSCESETSDTFCAVVHSCTVDDGNGDRIEILDDNGCALDKFILNNLEYPEDLMAGQEAHVYKYADRSQLFYQCQISISIKEPNEECQRPSCPEAANFGARKYSEAPSSGQSEVTSSPSHEELRTPSPNDYAASTASATSSIVVRSPHSLSRRESRHDFRDYGSREVTDEQRLLTFRLLRKRRQEQTIDVRAELTALEITETDEVLQQLINGRRQSGHAERMQQWSEDDPRVCLPLGSSSPLLFSLFFLSLLAFTLFVFWTGRRSRRNPSRIHTEC